MNPSRAMPAASVSPLAIDGNRFLRNGAPHRILSGALHYFRVPSAAWEDRLLKYRACGLNTVETYVAWNLHEPRPGVFDFQGHRGMLDLARFIRLAGGLKMDVILRPGPYICAEWDLGGLPAWLLADRTMRLRTPHPGFIAAVHRYFDRLLEEIRPLLAHNGGPIIAMQVENEYGSYGNSRQYLELIEQALLARGVRELLFTSDGPEDAMLQGGTLPHLFKTVNFGSRAKDAFATLKKYQPSGPPMCMEFWCGWFDHWGKEHHTRDATETAQALDELLSAGGSVNIYMMHGGTNFGFMAGANFYERYHATTSSYDYDAPLDERGAPTAKYHAFREILAKPGAPTAPSPPPPPARNYGDVRIIGYAGLFDHISRQTPVKSHDPLTQEDIGQNHGYTLYRTHVTGPRPDARLHINDVHDRAHVYQDGALVGILERDTPQPGLPIAIPENGSRLDILVENLGRINYGPIHDRKGIVGGVRLQWQWLSGWEIHSLDSNCIQHPITWREITGTARPAAPAFHLGALHIPDATPADTWLHIDGGHGAAWINGFCLGRYWNIGPQRSLLIPASFLQPGENQIIFFETDATCRPGAFCKDQP